MAAPKPPQVVTHVADPATPEAGPFVPKRENRTLEQERTGSGGLDDDPTDSGAPVKNTHPYKNLTKG